MNFTIYCDGSARNNGRKNAVGAWAYVILIDETETIVHQNCGVVIGATNQQMELTAAIEAIEYLFNNEVARPFDSVTVYTDSAYLHNCYIQKWYHTWQTNNWRNSKKEKVANRELWEKLVRWFDSAEVDFVKTKGHAGVKWNEYVDMMAQTASLEAKENK